MIEVQGISKRYGDIVALKDLSFSVEKGHIVGFLGANGAGKTTTMDILCGCIGADQGTVKVGGYEMSESPREAKRRMGYLPDEPPLHNDMRVQDYIEYAGRLWGMERNSLTPRCHEVMGKLGLMEVKSRLIGNLSKGFRQRVGLAQALIHNPEVLVLDEPTEGLDPNQIVQIRELIRSLKGEHTIVFSSHILSEVENITDEIIIIDRGHMVEKGTYDGLLAKVGSGRRYLVKVARNSDQLIQEIMRLPGVSAVHALPSEISTVEFSIDEHSDALDKVASLVVAGAYGLREIRQTSKRLEDIFFQLTNKNLEARI